MGLNYINTLTTFNCSHIGLICKRTLKTKPQFPNPIKNIGKSTFMLITWANLYHAVVGHGPKRNKYMGIMIWCVFVLPLICAYSMMI